MYYVLVDSHGASLSRFDDEETAVHEYEGLIREDPFAREDVALLACDDDGIARHRISAESVAESSSAASAR